MIRGLSHVTLAVTRLDRSLAFYRDVLGLSFRARWATGAYLASDALWLCLIVDGNTVARPLADYTHLAFRVSAEDFPALRRRVVEAGARTWKQNSSEGESHYFLDPDGHKLEIHVGSLQSRLQAISGREGYLLAPDPADGPPSD